MQTELQQTQARESALRYVKMFVMNGWSVKEETPESFIMARHKQSTLVHILLAICFWWLMFIPNIIYYFAKKERKVIAK